MSWGEQLETRLHTHTHTLGRRLRRWILSWKLLSGSNTRHWILQALESRLDGYRDVAGGLLSWRDEERAYPSVKCHHPSLPLRAWGRKAEGTGRFQGGGERGGRKKNRTRSVYDSTLCEGRLPCVSHRLSQVERTLSTDRELSLSVLVDCLSVEICFMSWRATRLYFSTLQDTLKVYI